MASEKLTALKVAKARTPGMVGDGKGLWLRVASGASKSWVFRYMLAGRAREMGMGSLDDVSLAKARELAREARRAVSQGIDPIGRRRAQRAERQLESARAMTFEECAAAYIAANQAGWKNEKHRKQWPQTLQAFLYPVFGNLPVQAVDVALVMKALEPIWTEKPETASRVRQRSRRCSIGPPRANSARGKTRHVGRAISTNYCRRRTSFVASSTSPHCLTMKSVTLCRSSGTGPVLMRERSNLRS
jgi:hypothetical protein